MFKPDSISSSTSSIKRVQCPYCNRESYFEEDMIQGHCIHCGSIVYSDKSSDRISLQRSSMTSVNKPVTYRVTFNYFRKALSEYAPSVTIVIDNRHKIVATSGKLFPVMFEEGVSRLPRPRAGDPKG